MVETRTIQLTVPASFEELCRKWAELDDVSPGDIARTLLNRGLDAIIEDNEHSPRFQCVAAVVLNELADSIAGATVVGMALD